MGRDDDDRVASVAMLIDGSAEKPFVIVLTLIGEGPAEQVVGPFSAEECRDELARMGVPAAAIEARIARARSSASRIG